MKVELIGTGCIGTVSNSASALINKKILLDTPNGVCRILRKSGESISAIQTVIITHYHADHFFDLPFLLLEKVFDMYANNNVLNIIGPKDIEKRTLELCELAFPGDWDNKIKNNLNVNFIELLPGNIKYLDDMTIEAVKVEHQLPNCQGYIITIDNQTCAFTGDTRKCEGVEYLLKKSKVLVADCALQIGNEAHMGINDIKEYAENYSENVIIGTHMKDATRKQAENEEIENFIIPQDGYSIEF